MQEEIANPVIAVIDHALDVKAQLDRGQLPVLSAERATCGDAGSLSLRTSRGNAYVRAPRSCSVGGNHRASVPASAA